MHGHWCGGCHRCIPRDGAKTSFTCGIKEKKCHILLINCKIASQLPSSSSSSAHGPLLERRAIFAPSRVYNHGARTLHPFGGACTTSWGALESRAIGMSASTQPPGYSSGRPRRFHFRRLRRRRGVRNNATTVATHFRRRCGRERARAHENGRQLWHCRRPSLE